MNTKNENPQPTWYREIYSVQITVKNVLVLPHPVLALLENWSPMPDASWESCGPRKLSSLRQRSKVILVEAGKKKFQFCKLLSKSLPTILVFYSSHQESDLEGADICEILTFKQTLALWDTDLQGTSIHWHCGILTFKEHLHCGILTFKEHTDTGIVGY